LIELSATVVSTQVLGLVPPTAPQLVTAVQVSTPLGLRSKTVVLLLLSSPLKVTVTVIWLQLSITAVGGFTVTSLAGTPSVVSLPVPPKADAERSPVVGVASFGLPAATLKA